jgi:hypothetical protein
MEVGMRAGLTAALAILAIAAIPAGASGDATSKAACDLTGAEMGDALGSSYTYSLKARNVSCDKAKRVLIKVNECRHDNGGRRGSCPGVKGYSCKQKKLDSTNTIYQAQIKCKKGSKKIVAVIGELV